MEMAWNVEEEAVLNVVPAVQVPELDVLFALPPKAGFWVAPCCWQLLAVTQRSLEKNKNRNRIRNRVSSWLAS